MDRYRCYKNCTKLERNNEYHYEREVTRSDKAITKQRTNNQHVFISKNKTKQETKLRNDKELFYKRLMHMMKNMKNDSLRKITIKCTIANV